MSRRCRHLGADLAGAPTDKQGCLVCPWHGARYDVETGRMVRGPQGSYAKVLLAHPVGAGKTAIL